MLSVLLLPSVSQAYEVEVHELMTRVALSGAGLDAAPTPVDADLPAYLRADLDARARAAGNADWAKRYPEPAAFDAWAEKELLLLAPDKVVVGIDRVDLAGTSLLDVAARSSRTPDDDLRNVDRYAYGPDRKRLLDADGEAVPADPAILNMGKLGSLSSQAHAHYGLADVELSEDSAVLQEDPRRFAVPAGFPEGPIVTLAPEMAQLHLDLALLAGTSGQPGAETLMWMHTGQGFHYLQDVGNQIHTVQVGLYDFFVDAFTRRLGMSFRTGGGYLGELRSLASLGIDILTNHHTISENYTQKHVMAAVSGDGKTEAERVLEALSEDDPAFAKALDEALAKLGPNPERGEFGRVITEALIEVSSHEGDDVYAATRAISHTKWRKPGVIYDNAKDDPDTAVVPETEKNAADYAKFWQLQETSFRRVGTAQRRWASLQQALLTSAQADPAALEEVRNTVSDRLISRQTAMLAEAEARRAAYVASPPEKTSKPQRAPGVLAAEIVLVGAAVGVPAAVVLSGE